MQEVSMIEYHLVDAPPWIRVNGRFGDDCVLHLHEESEKQARLGALKVSLLRQGPDRPITNATVTISASHGTLIIYFGSDNQSVVIGEQSSGFFELRLWRRSTINVGQHTTSNGTQIIASLSDVEIGEDCMFSSDVLIQSSDQHGVVDLRSGELVNNKSRRIVIGKHVWLGRRSVVMPDVVVGDGSIVGTAAVVTSDVPTMSVVTGVPARVIKTDTTWSRHADGLDGMAKKFVEHHRVKTARQDRAHESDRE
jgi:acetyltransferase-like isoleucine patch superfamily enzyme